MNPPGSTGRTSRSRSRPSPCRRRTSRCTTTAAADCARDSAAPSRCRSSGRTSPSCTRLAQSRGRTGKSAASRSKRLPGEEPVHAHDRRRDEHARGGEVHEAREANEVVRARLAAGDEPGLADHEAGDDERHDRDRRRPSASRGSATARGTPSGSSRSADDLPRQRDRTPHRRLPARVAGGVIAPSPRRADRPSRR